MRVKISKIRIDGGTQPRRMIDDDTVAEYAEAVEAGERFPPVDLFDDGSVLWLADGFHRTFGHQRAGRKEIDATLHKGTRRDAILFAAGANARHGLRRTNEDKRKAVETLLGDDEWQRWSNAEIARRCGVDEGMVRRYRVPPAGGASSDGPKMRTAARGGVEYQVDTANIGKTVESFYDEPPSAAPVPALKSAPPGKNGAHANGKHGGNGHAKAEPAPAEPTDVIGNVIRRKDVADAFARREELRVLMRDASKLKSAVLHGVTQKDPLYGFVNVTLFQAAINNVYQALKFAVPHALCPYHADDPVARKGCDACGGLGWVPKDTYDAAPANFKKKAVG